MAPDDSMLDLLRFVGLFWSFLATFFCIFRNFLPIIYRIFEDSDVNNIILL